MSAPTVVDASPIIVLAHAGYLSLLHNAGDPILIPQAVAMEIGVRGPTDPAVAALAQMHWMVRVQSGPVPPMIQAYPLGAGEAEVLTWALAHPGDRLILDDLDARRCALRLGLPVRGTLAVVIEARRQGIIPAARPVVEQLRQAGLYLTDSLANQALASVGE